MNKEQAEKLRAKGRLCYRPRRSKDGRKMMTSDGMEYEVATSGQITRRVPGERMNKKQRRAMRRELATGGAFA